MPNSDEYSDYIVDYVNGLTGDRAGQYIADIAMAYWVLLVMCLVAGILGLIYLYLLKCCAKPLLYISFLLVFLLLIAAGAFCYNYAQNVLEEGTDD